MTAAVPVRLGQYPVESRGAAAPLDVPQHRDARLYPSVGFVDVFVNSLAESGASSAATMMKCGLPCYRPLLKARMLSSGFGSNCGTNTASAPPAMALMSARYPQRRHITRPRWPAGGSWAVSFTRSMTSSAVFNAVSSVHCDRCVRAPHVVVYGSREAYHRHPSLLQPQRPGKAPLPADHDQPLDPNFLQPLGHTSLSLGGRKLRRTGGSQYRPAPVKDAAYTAVAQRAEPTLQQPPVARLYPHYLPTSG